MSKEQDKQPDDLKLALADYASVTEINKMYPRFRISTLRWYTRKKPHNFEKCMVKWGRKVYIHKRKFVDWANNLIKYDC